MISHTRSESPAKVYAEPARGHVHLGMGLRAILFFVPVILVGAVLFLLLPPVPATITLIVLILSLIHI